MQKPSRFWMALEALPGLSALAVEWQELVGEEWDAIREFLRPAEKLALSYPCLSRIECGCVHGVANIREDEYVAHCRCEPKRCPDTFLTRNDLFIYELDWRKLGETIAIALEASPGYLPNDEVAHAAIVGRYNPAAGEYFHFILLIAGDAREFQHRLEALILRFRRPFILLTPTRANFSPSADLSLQEHESVLLALDEILVRGTSGRMRCVQSPWDLLIEFGRRHVPSLGDNRPAGRPYVPPDTSWSQIEIAFRTGLDVRVMIAGRPHDTDLINLKLVRRERKNWVPNEQGELLRKFVNGNGYVYSSSDTRATTKKQCQRLAKTLRDYLGIPGDPISPLPDFSGWKANFRVGMIE